VVRAVAPGAACGPALRDGPRAGRRACRTKYVPRSGVRDLAEAPG
jgi:hypothetical protein